MRKSIIKKAKMSAVRKRHFMTAKTVKNKPLVQPSGLRIQFSSPSEFLGGPGMLRRTSRASWDLLTMTSLSLTAVCIRRTLEWSLKKRKKKNLNGRAKSALGVSERILLFLLTAWCSACPWSPRAWSSPSASLCTAWSSLWSKSSERGDGARSCRRSQPCLARRRRCRLHRRSRCSSSAAWSYDPSPAAPAAYRHTQTCSFSSHLLF